MCLIFTCGTQDNLKPLPGYEGVTAQCQNCGNHSARVVKHRPTFTFCFIPLVPLTMTPYQDVICPVCNFQQELKDRPDVQSQYQGTKQ